jgi:hypothetical protein
MGIFNSFKKKPAIKDAALSVRGIPTVKADIGIDSAYSEVFLKEMATIKTFSREDIIAMHDFISDSEDGFLNQGRYHNIIFERYFKDRKWIWPEHEKWKRIFLNLNEWPTAWERWNRNDLIVDKHSFSLYKILMRTIYHRAICFHNFKRQNEIGITKRNLILVFKEDKKFTDMALAENSNALTPLFPWDLSAWKCEIPGFRD